MNRGDMRATRVRLLGEARALGAAFPDADALRGLPVGDVPPAAGDDDGDVAAWREALGYLRDEMLLVRSGKADDLTVLDDEIACVERLPG